MFAISAGFNYLQTNLTSNPSFQAGYTLGWYGLAEYFITEHLTVLGDFTNFYNFHAGSRENLHGYTFGSLYSLSPLFGRITPYGFVEGGVARDSRQGVITYLPAAVGGAGFNIKLTHAVALLVIPGEYLTTVQPNGNFTSNYTTKAGFVFTTFRPKHHKI